MIDMGLIRGRGCGVDSVERLSPTLVHKEVLDVMYRTADSVTVPVVVHHVELCPATGDPILVEGPENVHGSPEAFEALVPEIGEEYTWGLDTLDVCDDVA